MAPKGEIDPASEPGEILSDFQLQMLVAHTEHLSQQLEYDNEKAEARAAFVILQLELDGRNVPLHGLTISERRAALKKAG